MKNRANTELQVIDSKHVTDVEFDGIDHNDCPDYVDAFISEASILDGKVWREATNEELEEINNDPDFVHEKLQEFLY